MSKCSNNMDLVKELFQKITNEDMNLEAIFQKADKNISGSQDEITLFIKDIDTKEYMGINLTYYFELWNANAEINRSDW